MRAALLISLVLFATAVSAQTNQYKNKLRSGLWITYHDSLKTKLDTKGRYKKGMQRGKWLTYDEAGNLTKREVYRRKKIRVQIYKPGNKLVKEGLAKVELNDSLYHYYFQGRWKSYNLKGELEKIEYYDQGKVVNEQLYKTSETPNFNDSLAKELKWLFNAYYQYADSVRYVKNNYGPQTQQYIRIRKLEAANDSMIRDHMERIIHAYGYPPKDMVGEEYTTLFFLISSYGQEVKEKYYEVIVAAADKGTLSWKDVSYFVDKVKVGRKEPQTYGTQSITDKNYNPLYYPIAEPEQLNERRRKVGLEEVDVKALKFTKYD
jgi:hypothetical protein